MSFLPIISLLIEVMFVIFIQITVQRIGPSMVQQFQSRCDNCGGKGEMINGIKLYSCFITVYRKVNCMYILK